MGMPPLSIIKLTLRTWLEIQNIDNLLKSQKSNTRDLNLLNKNQSKEFNKKPREAHITDQSKKSQLLLKEVTKLGNKRPKTLPRKLVKPFKMLPGIMFKTRLLRKKQKRKKLRKKKKLPKKKLPKRKAD